jgi:hypothetical protein
MTSIAECIHQLTDACGFELLAPHWRQAVAYEGSGVDPQPVRREERITSYLGLSGDDFRFVPFHT